MHELLRATIAPSLGPSPQLYATEDIKIDDDERPAAVDEQTPLNNRV